MEVTIELKEHLNKTTPDEALIGVMNIFNSIKATKKRKEKERIIEENKDNDLFLTMLEFTYNAFITTGLSKKKISASVTPLNVGDVSLYDAIDYIIKNNTGTKNNIAWVQGYIRSRNECLHSFLSEFFTKSIKVGINASTVNKIVPNLVPDFGLVLGEKYDDFKTHVEGNMFIITFKLDGMRLVTIKKGNEIKFRSKEGHLLEGFIELEEEAKKLTKDGVYDSEMVADGVFYCAREMYQATMRRAKVKGIKTGLRMYCFDYIENEEEFFSGICTTPCLQRKSQLEDIIKESNVNLIKYLKPLYIGKDTSVIKKLLTIVVKSKQEGLMINIADAPYECKRTKNLLKVKKFLTSDLRVIGYEQTDKEFQAPDFIDPLETRLDIEEVEIKNKRIAYIRDKIEKKELIGALIVDYKGYKVNVGSGLTVENRVDLWDKRDEIIDEIVEVQYLKESKNRNGEISLSCPTFSRMRPDKSEPSLH